MVGGEREGEQPWRTSRRASMSNLHLKFNPSFPSGSQIETSYQCSPSLPAWEQFQGSRSSSRKGGRRVDEKEEGERVMVLLK